MYIGPQESLYQLCVRKVSINREEESPGTRYVTGISFER